MPSKIANEELAAKKQSAAFTTTIDRLRRSDPDLPDKEAEKIALDALDAHVFGHDAKKDRKGNYLQQGIGAPGYETTNHFASIRRYEGKDAWEAAVCEVWKRDPKRAEALRLPNPPLPEKAK